MRLLGPSHEFSSKSPIALCPAGFLLLSADECVFDVQAAAASLLSWWRVLAAIVLPASVLLLTKIPLSSRTGERYWFAEIADSAEFSGMDSGAAGSAEPGGAREVLIVVEPYCAAHHRTVADLLSPTAFAAPSSSAE
jgi:hypothetical protein